jgi:sec-independent protein translocase protein TatC
VAVAIGRVGSGERLSTVAHLSELRARIIASLAAIAVAFGLCMWQNHLLLHLVNAPLAHETQSQVRAGHGVLGSAYVDQQGTLTLARGLARALAALELPGSGISAPARAALGHLGPQLNRSITSLSVPPSGDRPVTLGIGEPFTSTIGVALMFAFVLALPVLLYELYAFLLPALSPSQQRVATPLMLAIPVLFVAGAAFGYFVVLPAAVRFLQNFNSSEFNVLVQASQYYHFAAVTLLSMGLLFQIPVGILAATRAGIVTGAQLARNRRYAIAACGAVAALLPGDAITMLLETVPLYLLFEASLLLARLIEARENRTASAA